MKKLDLTKIGRVLAPTLVATLVMTSVAPAVSVYAQEKQIPATQKEEVGIEVPSKEELESLGLSEQEIQELMQVSETGITLKDGVAYDQNGDQILSRERGKLKWAVKLLRAAWKKVPSKVKKTLGGVAGFESLLSFTDHFTGKVSDAIYLGCRKLGMSKTVSWWVMKVLTLIAF
ncbi:hypothetical protein ACSMFR_05910 [Listeria aquatica]|uniref:hypothetical protein n=1 Tax=Listeria aquatica TaxID=1494960 RepID=UPI003F722099